MGWDGLKLKHVASDRDWECHYGFAMALSGIQDTFAAVSELTTGSMNWPRSMLEFERRK